MCARVAHYASSKNINLTSLSLRPSNSKLQTPAHHKQIGIFESSPQRACVDSDVASFNITPATQLMLNLDVFLASNGPCTNSLKIYSSTTWEDVVQDSYKRRKTQSAKRPVPRYTLALILILERGQADYWGVPWVN